MFPVGLAVSHQCGTGDVHRFDDCVRWQVAVDPKLGECQCARLLVVGIVALERHQVGEVGHFSVIESDREALGDGRCVGRFERDVQLHFRGPAVC